MVMPKALNLNPIQQYTYACDHWRVKSKMYERKKKHILPRPFSRCQYQLPSLYFFGCKEKRNLCKYCYAIFIIFILLRIKSLFNPISLFIYGLLFLLTHTLFCFLFLYPARITKEPLK